MEKQDNYFETMFFVADVDYGSRKKTLETIKKLYPTAKRVRVTDGYMVFYDDVEYQLWKNQR